MFDIALECNTKTEDKNPTIILKGHPFLLRELQEEMVNLKKLLHFLNMSPEKTNEVHTIYKNYDYISSYLEGNDFNALEKMYVIFYVVKKNNSAFAPNVDTRQEILDLNVFKELYVPEMDIDQFEEIAKNIDFIKIGNTPAKLLNENERIIKKLIIEATSKTSEKNKIFIKMHKSIQEHYLDKTNEYTEKDLKYVNVALKNLNVRPKICASIMRILTKKLQQRKPIYNEKMVEEKPKYNYDSLYKEASVAINLNNMKPYRALSLKEKIYYLSILTRMNVTKEERNLFLRNCEMLTNDQSVIEKYLENYSRLKYYEESAGLKNNIAFMEACLTEMGSCPPDDYLFWEESLANEMKQVEHWIPKNYEYEEVEASRLLSK